MVQKRGRPVSEVCHCFEPLPQILRNVRCKTPEPLREASIVTAIQAARDRLGEDGRLVIRSSGTEPVIRVMAEGDDRDLVSTVVEDIVGAFGRLAA